MYRLRWYCCAILNGGRFGDLCTIYQGCRALPFALAGLSCYLLLYCSSFWCLLSFMLIVPPTSRRCTLKRTYRERNSAVWCGTVQCTFSCSLLRRIGWYTAYTPVCLYAPNTPLEPIKNLGAWARFGGPVPHWPQPKTATAPKYTCNAAFRLTTVCCNRNICAIKLRNHEIEICLSTPRPVIEIDPFSRS